MKAKLIQSRFPVKACPVCGQRIDAGASVWYNADAEKGRKSWCEAHGANPNSQTNSQQQPAPTTPGSAPTAAIQANPNRPPVEKLHILGRTYYKQYWPSLADYIASAHPDAAHNGKARSTAEGYWSGTEYHDPEDSLRWYGIEGGQQGVIAAVTEGWPEGLARMMEDRAKIENSLPPPESIKRRRTTGDFGDTLDMGRVWAGHLDQAWTRCTRSSSRGPRTVKIIASMQGSGGTPAEVFFWRGAAVAMLSDILSEAGYAVEIEADYTTNMEWRSMHDACHRITIKPAQAPLDLSSIAAALGLSGFKRICGFNNLASTGQQVVGFNNSTWSSHHAVKQAPDELVGVEDVRDQQSAVEWVRAQLAAMEAQALQQAA